LDDTPPVPMLRTDSCLASELELEGSFIYYY
jgi:hypothetical protein